MPRPRIARRFIRNLLGWIQSLLGINPANYVPTRLSPPEYASNKALYHILDERIAGCVECYRIVYGGRSDLTFILISLPLLYQQLGERQQGGRPRDKLFNPSRNSGDRRSPKRSWRVHLERELANQLAAQNRVGATHLFCVAWIRQGFTHDELGRSATYSYLDELQVFACDLMGVRGLLYGDNPAKRITKAIARTFLKLDCPLEDWEKQVTSENWLTLLDAAAKRAIDQNHVLQPPISRSRPNRPPTVPN